MNLQFTKADKTQSKLRCAIFGPSGAGKTYSSLAIAKGLGGKIAVIDTERGSASKYADRFDFDVLELPQKDIETYVQAIKAAAQAGYEVLIIDSLSHGWQELLEEIDRLAKTKYRGNSWSAWSDGTPKQRLLVDAILDFPGHILATMRSKTAWEVTTNDKGKNAPVRVGLAPEQGKGIEYEFDLLLELSTEHVANVIKDRTGKYQDKLLDKPGEKFGQELIAWLSSGKPAPARTPQTQDITKQQVAAAMKSRDMTKWQMAEVIREWLHQLDLPDWEDTTNDQRAALIDDIKAGSWDAPPDEPANQGATGSLPASGESAHNDVNDVNDDINAMNDAATMDELKAIYTNAVKSAKAENNTDVLATLAMAKDARKAELEEAA